MDLIILAVIIYFVYRHFKKKKAESLDTQPAISLQALKNKVIKPEAEPTPEEEFSKALHRAYTEFCDTGIRAMEKTAEYYLTGYGTSVNYAEAEKWYQKAMQEKLALRLDDDYYLYDYRPYVDRYIHGYGFPHNMDKALSIAYELMNNNVPYACHLVDEIKELKRLGIEQVENTPEATKQFFAEKASESDYALYWHLIFTQEERGNLIIANRDITPPGEDPELEALAMRGNYRAAKDCTLELTDNWNKRYSLMANLRQVNIETLSKFVKAKERHEAEQDINRNLDELWTLETRQYLDENIGEENLAGKIDWILSKAKWPAAAASPPESYPQDAAFTEARELERTGSNYTRAAELYQQSADNGNIEALRRLGNICRQMLSIEPNDDACHRGTACLRQAAQAGHPLAVYDLGEATPDDIPVIAAMAKNADLEAIEALGCLMHSGIGNPTNPKLSRVLFHLIIRSLRVPENPTTGQELDTLSRLYGYMADKKSERDWMIRAAEGAHYAPALYHLALHPEFRLSPDFCKEKLTAAAKADYAPAKNALNKAWAWYQPQTIQKQTMQNNYEGYIKYHNLSPEEAKARVQAEFNSYSMVYRGNLILPPEAYIDPVFHCLAYPEEIARYDREIGVLMQKSQKESHTQAAASVKQAPVKAANLPLMLCDEWGRWWHQNLSWDDRAEYIIDDADKLDAADAASGFLNIHNRDGGTTVIITDSDIEGNKATAGGHTFTW